MMIIMCLVLPVPRHIFPGPHRAADEKVGAKGGLGNTLGTRMTNATKGNTGYRIKELKKWNISHCAHSPFNILQSCKTL